MRGCDGGEGPNTYEGSEGVDNSDLFAAIKAIADAIPDEALRAVPTDAAANVDKYLRRLHPRG